MIYELPGTTFGAAIDAALRHFDVGGQRHIDVQVTPVDQGTRFLMRLSSLVNLRGVTPSYGKYYMKIQAMHVGLLAYHNKAESLIARAKGTPCPKPLSQVASEVLPEVAPDENGFLLRPPAWLSN